MVIGRKSDSCEKLKLAPKALVPLRLSVTCQELSPDHPLLNPRIDSGGAAGRWRGRAIGDQWTVTFCFVGRSACLVAT